MNKKNKIIIIAIAVIILIFIINALYYYLTRPVTAVREINNILPVTPIARNDGKIMVFTKENDSILAKTIDTKGIDEDLSVLIGRGYGILKSELAPNSNSLVLSLETGIGGARSVYLMKDNEVTALNEDIEDFSIIDDSRVLVFIGGSPKMKSGFYELNTNAPTKMELVSEHPASSVIMTKKTNNEFLFSDNLIEFYESGTIGYRLNLASKIIDVVVNNKDFCGFRAYDDLVLACGGDEEHTNYSPVGDAGVTTPPISITNIERIFSDGGKLFEFSAKGNKFKISQLYPEQKPIIELEGNEVNYYVPPLYYGGHLYVVSENKLIDLKINKKL